MSTDDVTAEIAAVLAEHYPLSDYDGQIDECGCGQQIGALRADDRADYADHLADALADLLATRDRRVRAEAWMEGAFYYGGDAAEQWYFNDGGSATNPYHEADA